MINLINLKPLRPRRVGAGVAIAAVAACAVLMPATAQAAASTTTNVAATGSIVHPDSGNGETNTNTPLFYQPTSGDGYYAILSSGNWIDLVCWIDGGSYDGTNRWFEADYYGSYYFVSANQISHQPVLPVC